MSTRKHGGARAGAGRKPKAERFARPIARAEKAIADNLQAIIKAQIGLALGIWVEETDKDGKRIVYSTPPDRKAGEYLINRILGRPTEHHEIDVNNEAPLLVTEVVVNKTHDRPMENEPGETVD